MAVVKSLSLPVYKRNPTSTLSEFPLLTISPLNLTELSVISVATFVITSPNTIITGSSCGGTTSPLGFSTPKASTKVSSQAESVSAKIIISI